MNTIDNLNLTLLLDGCRKGKRVSQLKVYQHFYSYGMGVALRYSQTREEAMEIVNDGFLRAFTKINQYDRDLPFKPWLRRILINTAIDYYRKYHKQSNAFHDVGLPSTQDEQITNEALKSLAYEDTIQIIQKLSPAYRMVFNLFVMEDYSHQDIAEKLDISVGTSKSNLAKAKRKMKSLILASDEYHQKSVGNE